MNLVTKVAIGVGTVGGIGGASFAIQQQLSKEYISDKLVADGYEILKESSNAEWTAILTSYRTTANSNLKFAGFAGEEGKESDLKEKCKESLSKLSSDTDNYKKASQWCVVPKTILDLLKNKYTQLSTDESNEALNQSEWNTKIENHNKKDENTSHRFSKLHEITDINNIPKDNKGILAMKKQCKELESKKHHEPTFKEDLEKAKLWCYIEKDTRPA